MAIETDQLVLSNLFDLWQHFERFQGDEVGAVVAVVESYYPLPWTPQFTCHTLIYITPESSALYPSDPLLL